MADIEGIDWLEVVKAWETAGDVFIPAGQYDMEVVSADATVSMNGKPQVKIKLTVLNGPHMNHKVNDTLTLSIENATAVAIFMRHMAGFGLTKEFFANLGITQDLTPVAHALNGRRAKVTLKIDEYQGIKRNKIAGVAPSVLGAMPSVVHNGPPAPMPPGVQSQMTMVQPKSANVQTVPEPPTTPF